jgi:hypothetical protein
MWCGAALWSADATLTLPDPLVVGVDLDASLAIKDPASQVRKLDLPQVAGLTWQIGGTSSQTSIINGKVSRSETVRLNVHVDHAGVYRIGAITVHCADGSTLRTAPVEATASSGDTTLNGEADASVTFEPASIVPGQNAVMVYQVRLRQDRLRAMEDKPDIAPPADLIVLGDPVASSGSTYDGSGNEWSVKTWRWTVTCSKPGAYPVSGQQVWHLCQRDVFGGLRSIGKRVVAVKPAALTVAALPVEGRPTDFTGLIGEVTIATTLDRNRIATGEGTVLSITCKGRGVDLLARPALTMPTGLTAYAKDDAPADAQADKTKATERTFRWDLVPVAPGTYTLPVVTLPWFDPTSRTYRRAQGQELQLTVLPGRAVASVAPVAPAAAAAKATAPVTVNASASTALPPPLHGDAAPSLSWRTGLIALAAGLGVGVTVGGGLRLATRPRRTPHRGARLARALAANDLEAIAAALHDLEQATVNAEQRAILNTITRSVDQARFGGQALPADLRIQARVLEGIA